MSKLLFLSHLVLFGSIHSITCFFQDPPKRNDFDLNQSIELLRNSDHADVIFSMDTLCSQQFRHIGFARHAGFDFVNVDTDFGHNCKRNTKILVFGPKLDLVGYYQTPQLLPDTVVFGTKFMGQFENGTLFTITISDTLSIAGEKVFFQRLK